MSKIATPLLGAAAVSIAAASQPDHRAALDAAFTALNSYDYGSNRGALVPIDEAVRSSLGNPAASDELSRRLAMVLRDGAPTVAQAYVCGKLGLLASASSVPALAELLSDKDLAHHARSALEVMPLPEALKTLRESLPKLSGLEKVGVINSLGARSDVQSIPALVKLLEDGDARVAGAAAAALGQMGRVAAAQALRRFEPKAPPTLRLTVADACLACAERLVQDNKTAEALGLYRILDQPHQPEHIQMAARYGLAHAQQGR